ncbi:protein FAM107B-like [Sardina pilchardus]|uniref:protein FAM107B-like n=1 Tax=Sardina pilchardus TaxID=27697 RepID=UPI002E15C2A9
MAEKQLELIEARKVAHPMESPIHRRLLSELLLTHKWGLLPGERSELERVLDQRRLEKCRDQDQPVSDLEMELRKHRERLLTYELEEQRRRENQRNLPEFIRVRDNLRHIQVSGHLQNTHTHTARSRRHYRSGLC